MQRFHDRQVAYCENETQVTRYKDRRITYRDVRVTPWHNKLTAARRPKKTEAPECGNLKEITAHRTQQLRHLLSSMKELQNRSFWQARFL
jgi:hypothetical protein